MTTPKTRLNTAFGTTCMLLVLGLSLGFWGCFHTQAAVQKKTSEDTAARAWIRTELIFGLSKPGQKAGWVTKDQWREFLKTVVTPRFPGGLTVMDGDGQWRDAQGTVRSEPAKILLLVYPPDEAAETK